MLIWFINQIMNYRIDNLQYCNWSRKIFEINREANLDAVHVTIVYHEDFDELLLETKKWKKFFDENSDLIFYSQLVHQAQVKKLKLQSFQVSEPIHLRLR